MTVLQAGMAKSGNYWAHNILRRLLHHAGVPERRHIWTQPIYEVAKTWELSTADQVDEDVLDIERSGCYYRISSVFRMPVDDLDQYLNASSLVWTHSPICARSAAVLPKFTKLVYIVRDPRDVAISMAHFAFTPYMQRYYPSADSSPQAWLERRLTKMTRNWVNHVGGYLRRRSQFNIHVVFYERLLECFTEEVNALSRYLELDLDEATIEQIREEVAFESMVQKAPGHVRVGKRCRWVDELSSAQKRKARFIAGPMLRALGYSQHEAKCDAELPALPTNSVADEIIPSLHSALRRSRLLDTLDRCAWRS